MATGRERRKLNRRETARWLMACALAVSTPGCATPWFRKEKDPGEVYAAERDAVKELWRSEDRPRTIEQITRKVITQLRIENMALVSNLPGTGGKVEPSSQRDRMLLIMRKKSVPNPNQLLDDNGTAMVAAEVHVPPAASKRDRLNVLVTLSKHAEASNLQGGWLMNSELVEMSVLGNELRDGFGFAMAEGPLVTRQQITGETSTEAATKAMVVGGAELIQSRSIGLAIEDKFAHAVTMKTVLGPINKRFTVFDGANQVGAARPKQDNYIELAVPPRYRLDADHFASVVQHIGIAESNDERQARLTQCSVALLDPMTSHAAALQLEAAGKEAIPLLLGGLQHPEKEVRFYTAHALAYLNDTRAIPVLQDLAVIEPAFRAMCLNGLTLLESYKAGDALQELLNAPDAETRYGALLALREHDGGSPLVIGDKVGEVGSILEISSTGRNLVAIGLTMVPEIVIFGANPTLTINGFMYVNPRMMVRSLGSGRVSINHFVPGKDARTVECYADLKSMLNGIASVGGNYGDWVNFVRLCGVEQYTQAEIAMNPVPTAGRRYKREGFMTDEDSSGRDDKLSELNNIPAEATDPKEGSNGSWFNPVSWFSSK